MLWRNVINILLYGVVWPQYNNSLMQIGYQTSRGVARLRLDVGNVNEVPAPLDQSPETRW